jgi:O-antigen/teichoic acid export membrane protein
LALTGSEDASRLPARPSLAGWWPRLKVRLGDAEHVVVQRLAGTVFLIRVAGAMLAFGSQVLFARWMGTFEFGIYVYVWTWVMLLGQAIDLGLGTAARFPGYRIAACTRCCVAFVSGSRWLAIGVAIGISALGAGGVWFEPHINHYVAIPLYLACITLPAYATSTSREGISCSYDWVGLR